MKLLDMFLQYEGLQDMVIVFGKNFSKWQTCKYAVDKPVK